MSNKQKVTFEQDDSKLAKATDEVKESLRFIEDLKFFLATAPANWQENQVIRRYYLNHDEGFVSCVFWNNLYFITGTDIVRCIVYKFNHFGRKIIDRKKFEEGIFSDLRNLKCDTDAILEPPRSEFLEFLFKNSCLRTQKKQKVFFWFNVPHDKLMADALDRDLKKEKLGQKPTTIAVREPAKSFNYDETLNLFTQLADHMKLSEPNTNSTTTSASNSATSITNPNPIYSEAPAASGIEPNTYPTGTSEVSAVPETEPKEEQFLPKETPVQYKANSDYEDDFPLDYFETNNAGDNEEYINLDPNYHPGVYGSLLESNYDTIVDPSVFIQPNWSSMGGSNQVAYNDEYLIEQTQPLKNVVPLQLPQSASLPPQPRSAKFIPSASDEGFPSFPPHQLSAKLQTSFPRHPIATPSHSAFQQQTSYYDPAPQQYPYYSHSMDSYNYARHEPDYWAQPPLSALYGGSMEQMIQVPVHQPYVVMNEEYVPNNNSMYHVINPGQQSQYVNQVVYPSNYSSTFRQQQQQQQQQNSKSRRQFYQQSKGVSKPQFESDYQRNSKYSSLDDVITSNATKVVNIRKDEPEETTEPSENVIQTPPASANQI